MKHTFKIKTSMARALLDRVTELSDKDYFNDANSQEWSIQEIDERITDMEKQDILDVVLLEMGKPEGGRNGPIDTKEMCYLAYQMGLNDAEQLV